MEEFLQLNKTKLSQTKHLDKVHVVLGKKSCDLDSLISALTYAYYLDKISPPGTVCLPVLNTARREFCYYTETRFILEELSIPESLCVFRDEINLHQLNNEGKLSLTLVNSSALTSEDKNLESATVRVINAEERCDGNLELLRSSSCLVAKEILQEAPELITQQLAHLLRGSILSKAMAVDPEQTTEEVEEVLSNLEEKFPELLPREDMITFLQEAQFHANGIRIDDAMLQDIKEVSDGEIKVAVSTVYMDLENCLLHRNMTGDLKTFAEKYSFDVLVILANYLSEEGQEKRQIAVYSDNMELGNQICCELEECQTPCLELDPLEYGCDQFLIYQQENSLANCDEILLLMKDVMSRRNPEVASNSRTSSTEAVAGSAPLSQGSSGIMELYGSDIEPQPNAVNFIENPPDNNGSAPAHADVNIDLASPDSGLATIRSSRSSKESSVFLSDDSPVGEGAASHHSFLAGFDSYSPIPEGAIAEDEKPQSKNSSDSLDLFNFDLAPTVVVQSEYSHSVDCSPSNDFFSDNGSPEEQPPTDTKVFNETNLSECDIANYSTDLPMRTNEEADLAKFDECSYKQQNPSDFCKAKSNWVDLEDDYSSCPEVLKNIEKKIPPTPVNSLVESSPLDSGQHLFYPQEIIEKMNEIDHVTSSQSRIRYGSWWEGFELDTKNADAWSSVEPESVFESPDSWKEYKANVLLRQQVDRRASDSVCVQKQQRPGQYSRAGVWEDLCSADCNDHALVCQQKDKELHMENFSNMWKSSKPNSALADLWSNNTSNKENTKADVPNVWAKIDQDSKGVQNVPQVNFDQISLRNLDTWPMSNCSTSASPECSADNEFANIDNQIDLGYNNKGQDNTIEKPREHENEKSYTGNTKKNAELAMEHQGDPVHKPKQFDSTGGWGMYDTNISKEVLGSLSPWEDPFLSYRDSDFIASHTCEDLVSPPDTNYSTSDSDVSPTEGGDKRESEGRQCGRESVFEQMINPSPGELEAHDVVDEKSLPQSSFVGLSISNLGKASVNNENQMEAVLCEMRTNSVFSQSEQKDAGSSSDDESNPISEDCGTLISEHRNSHSVGNNVIHMAEVKDELDSGVILEDTQSTKRTPNMTRELNLETDDLDISVSDHNVGSEEAGQGGTRSPDKELNQEDKQWKLNHQADRGFNDISSSSVEGVKECKMTEGRGEQDPNNIRNEIMEYDNTPLTLLLHQPSVNSPEKRKSVSDYPTSSENKSSIGNLEEVVAAMPSERNILFPAQTDSANQETKKIYLDSSKECFAVTPKEDNQHLVHFELVDGPKCSFNIPFPTASQVFDRNLQDINIPDTERPSFSSSPRRENNQEKHSVSPVMRENQGFWNELMKNSCESEGSSHLPGTKSITIGEHQEHLFKDSIPNVNFHNFECQISESPSEMNSGHEASFEDQHQETENPKNPYAGYVEAQDTTHLLSITNDSLSFENSLEKSENSDSLESENKLSSETCVSIIPHHALPHILKAFSVSKHQPIESVGTSPEISESLEVSDTVNSFPTDIPVESICKEDSICSGSIDDYTHSSATTPDISDSSTNMHIWDNLEQANDQNTNEDAWSDTDETTFDACGKENMENISQDSETSTDQKVPKNLDIWNTHIDDDTVSSLSSPGIDEDSEYTNIQQAQIQSESHSDEQEDKIKDRREQDYLLSGGKDFTVDSASSNVQPDLKNKVNVTNSNTSSEDTSTCNITMEGHEASEYLVPWETNQGEAHVDTSQGYPDNEHTWNSCIMNDENAPKHSDAWDELLQDNSENALGKDQKHIMETLGFSDDSSEWWNLQVQDENLIKNEQFSLDDGFKISDELATAHDTSGPLMQRNAKQKELKVIDALSDKNEYIQCNSEGECKNGELSVITQEYGLDLSSGNIEECGPLSPLRRKNGKNVQEESFVPADINEDTLESPVPEDWQALAQVNPVLGLLRGNFNVTSRDQNEVNLGNPFNQKLLDASKNLPSDPLPPLLTARKSSPTYKKDRALQQKPFIPDILQNNTPGDCQPFTVDPDLWTDADQPFILGTSRENPDILDHCDQESSSQASSSPDICQEYKSKQTRANSSILAEPEEAVQVPSDRGKDIDGKSQQQQQAIGSEELCLEGKYTCGTNNQRDISETYQLTPSSTEDPSDIEVENIMQESDTPKKPTNVELVYLASSETGVLEIVSLNLESNTFEYKNMEEKQDSGSPDASKFMDHNVGPVFPTDDSACCNFPDNDNCSFFDHSVEKADKQETANPCTEICEGEKELLILVKNNHSNIFNETDQTAILNNELEDEVETETVLKKTPSLQFSLEEEGEEDFQHGAASQYGANLAQEPNNMHEIHSPWDTSSPNKQSSFACSSPFEVSFGADFALQKDDMDFSESSTNGIIHKVADCSQADQGWGSLLLESEGTPDSSTTLKAFEYETESSNIDSPSGEGEMSLPDSKASDVKGEAVADHCQEDQGWGSFLLESDETLEAAPVFKELERATDSHDSDSADGGGEMNLSECKPRDGHSQVGECSQDDQDWRSLLLEAEAIPKSTDSLKEFEYEANDIHTDSPAGGVTANYEIFSNEDKGFKSTESPGMIRTECREDTKLEEIKDQSAMEMDYVLITGEENVSLRQDILVTQESNFVSQEAIAVAEQADPLETFSANSSGTFQSISIISESEGQPKLETEWNSFYLAEKSLSVVPQKWGDEKKSPQSPRHDQEWTMVGQNGVDEVSPEESRSRTATIESLSRDSVQELGEVVSEELIYKTQAATLPESNPQTTLEQEDKSALNRETDGILLQGVAGDDEGLDSQQRLGDSMVTQQEVEQETQFAGNERRAFNQMPGMVPENVGMDIPFSEAMLGSSATEMRPETPNSLDFHDSHPRKIKLTAPNINLSLDQSEGSVLSDDNLDTPDEIDINVDDLDTPDEADSFEYAGHEEQAVIKDPSQVECESIPEYTAEEEREDNRLWRTVVIGEQEQRIDIKAIEPYKRVISHGGYYGDGVNAIIVFAACFLPDSSQADYNYVMENLFLYVISTLELMVAEDYMIVYLNGATPRRKMPGLGWMKRCYQMIDRRLRKNLKSFIIVHPSWFIRTILTVTRPFISSKFSSKIQYVSTLAELSELIPMEYVNIPESILKYDEDRYFQRRLSVDMKLKGHS